MKLLARTIYAAVLFGLAVLLCSAGVPVANGQVTQSPSSLSFAIPTGSVPAVSAAQVVTVSIPANTTVTFSAPTISGAGFSISGNACQGTITGPTTCGVNVTFASMLTTLQTGSLQILGSGFELAAVPLSGAFGAIKLFVSTRVETSNKSATLSNPFVYGNSSLSLSCPSPITATLSSTPDGNGYVLEDNYLSLSIDGAPAATGNNPAGNVCRGGPADQLNGTPLNDCFSTSYQVPAGQGQLNGQDPDTFANPGNAILQNQGNPTNAGGVTPIDIHTFFHSGILDTGVTLLDGGGFVAGASLFLVTNCTVAGVAPGSTVVNNPINAADPSTLTQTAAFDNTAGQNISLTTSYAAGVSAGTVQIPDGTTQRTVNIGIPQQLFSQLVASTSAAPSVCLRLTGELDPHGQPMCKGFLVQCSLNGGPFTGDNCVPTNSTVRNLFDAAKFSSPDAPDNGTNYLGSACAHFLGNSGSCASTALNGQPPTVIGPGILLGSDNWTCASGEMSSSCKPQVADTTTPTSPATYSSANCVLTGGLTGDLCPLDTLTYFAGESDPTHGSTTTGKNSLLIPVVNMPLPFTVANVTNANAIGWVNTGTANASFQSNAANYPTTGNIPAANGFTPAPPYSVTYGISPASSPLPDTTYPVPADKSQFNTNTSPNFGTPLCQTGTPAISPAFLDSFSPGDGIYNLHYFTTDCALTEELLFNPTAMQLGDPAANWASFRTITFGIDTAAPLVTSCNSPSTSVWYNTNQTVNCTITDQNYKAGVSGSGFLPIVSGIQGSQSEGVAATTNVAPNTVNAAAATTPTQACDLAGNCVNIPAGPFMIDRVAPTITGPTLAPAAAGNIYFVGGPAVTVTYTCSDGAAPNSGIASCTGPLPSGSAIDTSGAAVGPHMFTVTATDNAGNQSQASVNYSVAYASADLAIAASNLTAAETGEKVVYGFVASDLGPNIGLGVKITDTLPAGLTFVSGSFTNGISGGNCSNAGGTVTCAIGAAPVLPARGSIYIGQITAKVTAKAGTVITNTISISGLNPDPNPGNNSSKVKVTVTP